MNAKDRTRHRQKKMRRYARRAVELLRRNAAYDKIDARLDALEQAVKRTAERLATTTSSDSVPK